MSNLDKIKLFTVANSLTEYHLDNVEEKYGIELQREPKQEIQKKEYYLQFGFNFRKEAKLMAEHYEVFYCLENLFEP